MNFATLVPALLELLKNFPNFWMDVLTFWTAIHSHPSTAPHAAAHHDEVTKAVAAAKAQVGG